MIRIFPKYAWNENEIMKIVSGAQSEPVGLTIPHCESVGQTINSDLGRANSYLGRANSDLGKVNPDSRY